MSPSIRGGREALGFAHQRNNLRPRHSVNPDDAGKGGRVGETLGRRYHTTSLFKKKESTADLSFREISLAAAATVGFSLRLSTTRGTGCCFIYARFGAIIRSGFCFFWLFRRPNCVITERRRRQQQRKWSATPLLCIIVVGSMLLCSV